MNNATTIDNSFQSQNLDCFDAAERDHPGLIDRKEIFGISISDRNNEALTEIAWILMRWPEGFRVKKLELAAIAADADEADLDDLWGDIHGWFPAFLPSLNAWRDVSQAILRIKEFEEYGPGDVPLELLEGRFDELNELLADVLDAYAPADRETFHWRDTEHSAKRELLKQYSRYTCCVCEFAKEVWPAVNLDALLHQV